MAAIGLTPTQVELISSLSQDDIPIKLRCAICSKLAVNAYRLPCCEQAICETCQSTLPASCPVCEHSPLSAGDCNVHKSLRTTIRVFIRTEEKKREVSRPKESPGSMPPTPVESSAPSIRQLAAPVQPESGRNAEERSRNAAIDGELRESAGAEVKHQPTIAAAKSGSPPPDQGNNDSVVLSGESEGRKEAGHVAESTPAADQHITEAANPEQSQDPNGVEQRLNENSGERDQSAGFDNGFGFDAMPGPFPNPSFGTAPDYNQMPMMMAMQNGMNPNAFGGFPMMGMSGMGMDPLTMQNMYMNGGFGSQGMGMNGMNMNVGMGGFGGGSGSNNNWSGQQSWNNGQDNYNHPNAGMGNGDYGNFNTGFHKGYNQGNYGHQGSYNDYRRGYGFRGRGFRGRGTGGYARGGGFAYGNNAGFQDQGYISHQYSPGGQYYQANGFTNEPPTGGNGAESSALDNPGETIRTAEGSKTTGEGDGTAVEKTQEDEGSGDPKQQSAAAHRDQDKVQGEDPPEAVASQSPADGAVQPIPTFDDSFAAQNGDAVYGDPDMRNGNYPRGGFQNGSGHRGGFGGMPPPSAAPSSAPINAPSGPKAMRQGLPNTSFYTLRARGLIGPEDKVQSQSPRPNGDSIPSPAVGDPPQSSRGSSPNGSRRGDSKNNRVQSKERNRPESQGRERTRDRELHGRDRSESVLSSKTLKSERKELHRHRPDGSESEVENGRDHRGEDDHHEGRRSKHHSRRKYSSYGDDRESDKKTRVRDEKQGDRSRSASPDDSRRSSHRSRRERDADRRREREKERDRDGEDDRRRSNHRSRRGRERDRDRDYDRDRDRDRTKGRDRDNKDRSREHERDREREHRHRSKRSSVEPPTPSRSVSAPEEEFDPPTGPRRTAPTRSFDIRGQASSRSRDAPAEPSRRASQSSGAVAAAGPAPGSADAHAAERERRNRERLLRETQRLALAGAGKRGRDESSGGGGDEGAGGSGGKRSRRKGRRGEVVSVGDEEERMRRLEAEREVSRWD